jgi:SAM-dependent methyltransferase
MKKMNSTDSYMRKISKDNFFYFLNALIKTKMKCPYCQSLPLVYGKKYLVFDISKCQKCGLFFVNPTPLLNKNLEKFYDERYYSSDTAIPNLEELKLLKKQNFRGSKKDCHEKLAVIRRLSSGNRLLEFGAGWGYFLFQAAAYNFFPVGVEISRRKADFGRNYLGVDIYSDIDSTEGKFDIICTFHTLEHLTDLKYIFDKFYQRLLPNGVIIIEVPNFDPETKGRSVFSIIGKVHPLGFSNWFFGKNLQKHGFSEINIAGNYADLLKKPNERTSLENIIIVYARKI